MTLHYDPLYARSQRGNFSRLQTASRVEADTLTASAIDDLAARVAPR
jgi:hypothetical protein